MEDGVLEVVVDYGDSERQGGEEDTAEYGVAEGAAVGEGCLAGVSASEAHFQLS